MRFQVYKSDDEDRITEGVVYHANRPDAHGEFVRADVLRRAAWEFNAKFRSIDTMHDGEVVAAEVVESWITKIGFRVTDVGGNSVEVRPGDWLAVVRWPPAVWAQVKAGKINAFSFEGSALKIPPGESPQAPAQARGETT